MMQPNNGAQDEYKRLVIPSIMLQGIPQTVTLDQCVSDND